MATRTLRPEDYDLALKSGVNRTQLETEYARDPNINVDAAIGNALTPKKVPDVVTPDAVLPKPPTYRYTGKEGSVATTDSTDPVAAYYEGLNRNMPSDADEAAIRQKRTDAMQDQIDAIEARYKTLIADETVRQDKLATGSAARVRGLNVMSGLSGAPDASKFAQEDETRSSEAKNRALAVLENEKAVQVAQIRGAINAKVDEDLKAKRDEALGNRDAYVQYLEKSQAAAREMLPAFANNSREFTPEERARLMKSTGYDELTFDALVNNYKAPGDKIDYKYEITEDGSGNKVILAYGMDPATGKLVSQTYNSEITGGKKPEIFNGMPYIRSGVDSNGNPIYTPVQGVTPNYEAGAIGEYQFYADQERAAGRTPVSFDKYQTMDANRKAKATGSGDGGGIIGTGTGGSTGNPVIDSWVSQIKNGQATVANVPAALKNSVIVALNSNTGSDYDPSSPTSPESILAALTALKSHPGLTSAVGAKGVSSLFGLKDSPVGGSQAASFIDKLNSVKSLLTLPNLGMLKGPMSDKDLAFIQSAGSSLAASNTEEDFKAELDRITNTLQKGINTRNASNAPAPTSGNQEDLRGKYNY